MRRLLSHHYLLPTTYYQVQPKIGSLDLMRRRLPHYLLLTTYYSLLTTGASPSPPTPWRGACRRTVRRAARQRRGAGGHRARLQRVRPRASARRSCARRASGRHSNPTPTPNPNPNPNPDPNPNPNPTPNQARCCTRAHGRATRARGRARASLARPTTGAASGQVTPTRP